MHKLLALLCLTAISSGAMAQDTPFFRSILVRGAAQAELPPDIARIALEFESEDRRSEAAIAQINTRVNALIARLDEISEEQIEAAFEQVSIQPSGKSFLWDNITVSQRISVEIKDMEIVPSVIDALAASEPNWMGSLLFTSSQSAKVERELKIQAAKDAKAQAEAIIAQTGGKLGAPLEIDQFGANPMMFEAVVMEEASISTRSAKMQIAPPSTTVISAQIEVRYEILPE